MKVKNLNDAPNQYVIEDSAGNITFQSYQSKIATLKSDGSITVFKDWDYSATTSKYRNLFFRDYLNLKELDSTNKINKAIDSGIIKYKGVE